MFAARALKGNNGVQSETVTGKMRGQMLPMQMCVVCTLASISMTALVLYTIPYYNSAQKISVDCAAAVSSSQQPVTPLRGVAARYVSEPLNNSNVSSKGRHSEPACTIDHEVVLNFSQCHLSRPFLVYLYNSHFPDLFQLKYPTVLTEWETHLDSVTSNPSEACVFIAVVGPLRNEISKSDLESKIRSLPYWDSGGVNHVLIELSDTGRTSTLLNELSPCNAIIASTYASHNRQPNHILAPPILPVIKEESITESHTIIGHSSILPVRRELFVYFEGNLVNSDEDMWQIDQVEQFRQSVYRLKKHNHIQIKCGWVQNSTLPGAMDREWALCDSWLSPQSHCHRANFSLIPSASRGRAGAVTYARLINSLRCGSIPLVIGVSGLPFNEVINWRRAAILLPSSLMTDALYIMSAMTEDEIMEYRKQGRFLFEMYFASHKRILDSILAIVRYRFFHPPPLAPEFIGTSLVTTGKHNKIEPSLSNNFLHSAVSVYTEKLWNDPPGPFYVYPITPFKPVSMSHYSFDAGSVTRDESQLRERFVGVSFRKHLRGDYTEEGFTIVTLTYHRNEQLLKMLASFEGCPYLVKVVVVWNNEEDPPRSMVWPDIGVPIEVVRAGRNSLNNRFLPFSNIQTEAVLSLDDDIVLTHEEIEFAFRVWRENRAAVVGWTSRFHRFADGRWLYSFYPSCEVSMVITNAAFFHKYYSYLYSYWMPQKIREMVDERMNCEDIAMNFLITHISKKPPIKVGERRRVHSTCKSCDRNLGLSSSNTHYLERDLCVNILAGVYGYVPLLHTQFRVEPILSRHSDSSGTATGQSRCFESL